MMLICIILTLMSTCFSGVSTSLAVEPAHITAYVGADVTMSCSTTLDEAVDWRRRLASADRFEIFCFRGVIKTDFQYKFSISNPENGLYVITAKNVRLNDSGEYRCIEGVDKDPNYDTVFLSVIERPDLPVTTSTYVPSSTSEVHVTTASGTTTLVTVAAEHDENLTVIFIIILFVISVILMIIIIILIIHIKCRRRPSHALQPLYQPMLSWYSIGSDGQQSHFTELYEAASKRSINHLFPDSLEIVLLKSAALMCRKISDGMDPIETLCKVSFAWWHVMRHCRDSKKGSLQRSLDGVRNCVRGNLMVHLEVHSLIQGVAFLGDGVDKLYATTENCNTISVFSAVPPYEQLRGICISGMTKPTDIVACSNKKLLYVSAAGKKSAGEGCVWQVTTGGKVDVHHPPSPQWSPPTIMATTAVCPVSLSVWSGRLVVVAKQQIAVYEPYHYVPERITFPQFITLHHAVEIERDTLFVAFSENSSSFSGIRKLKRDNGGHWFPMNHWNSETSISTQVHVKQPMYMAWHTPSALLYVAVRGSRKVLVVNSALEEIRSVFLRRHSWPNRLCFSAQQDKLFLTVGAGFGIDVYDGVMWPDELSKKLR